MTLFHPTPVASPGLAIFMVGALTFVAAVLLARRRRRAAGQERVAQSRSASWIWIAVQSLGVALTGIGPVHAVLAPTSPAAIGAAIVVLVLIVAAVCLFHASSRAMGTNWSLVARVRDDHALVRSGPFAYLRHPIYIAILLFILAMAVAYGHVASLIVALPVYALGTWMRVRHEERLLRDTFGAAYDEYAREMARFVPGLF